MYATLWTRVIRRSFFVLHLTRAIRFNGRRFLFREGGRQNAMQRAPTRHCSRTPRQTVVCRDRCIQQVEYVVMGCGIVGLSCARHLLSTQKNARVTVLEKSAEMLAPSSKTATGAGQGYALCVSLSCGALFTQDLSV